MHSRLAGTSRALWLAAVLVVAWLVVVPRVEAQGCSQCLDSTRTTPPQVQAAYRHAIYLLGGTASTFFVAGTLLLGRHR